MTRTVCFLLAALLVLSPSSSAASSAPLKGRSYYEARGEIIWEVNTDQKVIALTFDDGPDPQETPAILDLLQQYEAKATFFVIGKHAEKYPELILRELKEGHELANHTYNHLYFSSKSTEASINSEIQKTETALRKLTGEKPSLFRPPGGFYNENLIRVAKDSKYQIVLWSWHQDTKDWKRPGVQKIVKRVLSNARNGDIVLLHDHVHGSSQTIEALQTILPALKEQGFRFVTVSELLGYQKSTPVAINK